ncbi:hypothetical protein AB4Z48_30505 [Cupriavidus sp. 2TAF22]|uniref:hypothetical protein n=1 Tax=unclassified Cupriavidus TaxID=2640874 RepID=UPI003F8E7D33
MTITVSMPLAAATGRAKVTGQEEGIRQVEALERQLLELRTQFSTELERIRVQVAIAQVRASAIELRAQLETALRRAAGQCPSSILRIFPKPRK